MSDDLEQGLRALATAAGVETEYWDVSGTRHVPFSWAVYL